MGTKDSTMPIEFTAIEGIVYHDTAGDREDRATAWMDLALGTDEALLSRALAPFLNDRVRVTVQYLGATSCRLCGARPPDARFAACERCGREYCLTHAPPSAHRCPG